MNTRHNCCKENDFDWKSIDPLGNSADRLVCNICKREFIDTIFIEKIKELRISDECLKEIDKLSGDLK